MTHKLRFGHVNVTNRSSYLNIICNKLVTQVKKSKIKTKVRTFDLRFLGFKNLNLKFGLFFRFLVFKN